MMCFSLSTFCSFNTKSIKQNRFNLLTWRQQHSEWLEIFMCFLNICVVCLCVTVWILYELFSVEYFSPGKSLLFQTPEKKKILLLESNLSCRLHAEVNSLMEELNHWSMFNAFGPEAIPEGWIPDGWTPAAAEKKRRREEERRLLRPQTAADEGILWFNAVLS